MQRISIGQITGELKKQIELEVMHIFSNAAPEKEQPKQTKTVQQPRES
jgi:hypothetical protein